jgi:glycosyltransferase involved in cell wall biosynthesis
MALSGEQRQEIMRLYDLAPAQVSVVGAGYNDALFSPGAKLDAGPVQLVYAGKLSRAKGVPWLLRALSRIDAPDWRLHLVGGGSGEEQDECLSLARRLGRRVHVHGVLPQEALAEIMRQSHVLVLPSFYEGFGLVVLEGLACGCRIVATDLAGIREMVGDAEVGFVELVEPPRLRAVDQPYDEDVGGFEERMTGALRAQLNAARRRPVIDTSPLADRLASYSWEGIFKKVHDVYELVLAG